MNINKVKSLNHLLLLFFTALLLLSSCGALAYKRADVKDSPINDADKRKKNMEEGRKITFGKGSSNRSGSFDFASSNEMWRATIDILDFAPLLSANYGGGIIITDWYSDNAKTNETIKISIQFLSNEIRSDGLTVKIYNKKCDKFQNCAITKVNSELNSEIKLAILKKATLLRNDNKKKKKVNKW
jgi:hypothetical protein